MEGTTTTMESNTFKKERVVILSAVRSPIGSFNGALSNMKAHEIGAQVIAQALRRASVEPSQVSDVLLGQVLTAGQGQNPARQAAIGAGLPFDVPAANVGMLCGSGLRAVVLGAQAIQLLDAEIVVVGGQESMSQAHHSMHLRSGIKMGNGSLVDTMLTDGLTDAFQDMHMGITAENVAAKYQIERDDQDKFALMSQKKAGWAAKGGIFNEEIVPIQVSTRNGSVEVGKDEYIKLEATLDQLQKLKPAFIRDGSGTVTAGNASGINDGAAVLVLGRRSVHGKGLAEIVSHAQSGCDPQIMGIGPVEAVRMAVKKAGWSLDDVDLFELNEAFAAQALAVVKELGIGPEKVNVNGGAIALGHPIGASGARILVTLIYALKQRDLKKGVAALCIGGGMGIAMCIEISEN